LSGIAVNHKIEREEPTLVPNAISMLIAEKVKKKDQILMDLSIPAADLQEITCMPFGYFRSEPAQVIPIPKSSIFGSQKHEDVR
jgi:hypothetical protein